MHVHHGLRYDAGDQADQDVPNEMKHKNDSELLPRPRFEKSNPYFAVLSLFSG